MQKITKKLENATYSPKAALIAYANNENDFYLETREILSNGEMGAAKPLTYAFINKIIEGYSKSYSETPYGPIPENMLYADTRPGNEKYVWWNPPMKRNQTFVKELGMEDGMYPMPGVIYAVKNNVLYVYAYAGKKPRKNTQLLKGPFFNYYNECRVCLGTATCELPKDLKWDDLLKAWENLFWNSVNSHTMRGAISVKGNLTTILKEHKDKDSFDTSLLIKTIYKTEDLWKKQ